MLARGCGLGAGAPTRAYLYLPHPPYINATNRRSSTVVPLVGYSVIWVCVHIAYHCAYPSSSFSPYLRR